MRHKKVLFILVSLIALLFSFSTQAAQMQNLRGQRYCEILLGTKHRTPAQLQVYNTIGLNNCPENLWSKITPETIKKETGASYVHLNGPRYWTIDGFQNTSLVNPTPKTLGGIAMRDAGILKLGVIDIMQGQKPYSEHKVHRQTTWIYNAGKPVYEITSADGKVYIMQSYSIQKVSQTEGSLAELQSKLHLPKGWKFSTRVLKDDMHVTPLNQQAVVIQDDFWNTYQLETAGK